jgi:hypothetical protein
MLMFHDVTGILLVRDTDETRIPEPSQKSRWKSRAVGMRKSKRDNVTAERCIHPLDDVTTLYPIPAAFMCHLIFDARALNHS